MATEESAPVAQAATKRYDLEQYQMLRYEATSEVSIELVTGQAEVFGSELIPKRPIILTPGQRGTILTFTTATIDVFGSMPAFVTCASDDQEIPHVYINLHAALERMRDDANSGVVPRGPRVLICGNESVGKSTLCRVLASYAARKRRKPILVDVNVGLSQVSIPGTMSAVAVTKPYDMEECWRLEEDPLVFCFGHLDPADNLNLYREQVNRLAEMVNIRSENDSGIFASGCIINMNGFRKDDSDGGSASKGIATICTTAAAFEVDMILVIEDGFLESYLRNDLPKEVIIVRIPKSAAVHTRTTAQWTSQRDQRIFAYFHGEGRRHLQPHQLTLNVDTFTVYKIGGTNVPNALLRSGETTEEDNWRKPIPLRITSELTNHLLAISQAQEADQVPEHPVYGFVVVLSVAEDKQSITVLAPSHSPPPTSLFVYTDMKYVESEK